MSSDEFNRLFNAYFKAIPWANPMGGAWYAKNVVGVDGEIDDLSVGIHRTDGIENVYTLCGSMKVLGFRYAVGEIGYKHPQLFPGEHISLTGISLEKRLTGECRIRLSYRTWLAPGRYLFRGQVVLRPTDLSDRDIRMLFRKADEALTRPERKRPIRVPIHD